MHLWLERVPTDDNISDLPSRESYVLLEACGAEWREPTLSAMFMNDLVLPGVQ